MLNGKKICIFCSSSNKIDQIFFDAAKQIASFLTIEGTELVFGGGEIGLMGIIAKTFKNNNRKVISVIPKKLNKKGVLFEKSDQIIETETMNERKNIMANISDAFIALPGGFGTLEEILEVITLKQLGYLDKPISILNTNGFYNPLLNQLETIYTNKFADEKHRNLYFTSNNPKFIINYLKTNINAFQVI